MIVYNDRSIENIVLYKKIFHPLFVYICARACVYLVYQKYYFMKLLKLIILM